MKSILALLHAFFCIGAVADQEDAEPELDLQADDPAPGPDDQEEEDAPDGGEDPAPDKAELETLRSKTKDLEEKTNRYERELAEARRGAPQARPDDDIVKQENARLADPAITPLEKWQIQSNRELRAGRSEAQAALMQAHDVSDRTAYAALCIGDPLAKKYEERVEKKLAEFRSKGINAPREEIYTFMLGKDMRDGKFKKKAAAPAPKQDAHPNLNRGRMPGARSDVSGRTAMSEREKRAKRLENVQI